MNRVLLSLGIKVIDFSNTLQGIIFLHLWYTLWSITFSFSIHFPRQYIFQSFLHFLSTSGRPKLLVVLITVWGKKGTSIDCWSYGKLPQPRGTQSRVPILGYWSRGAQHMGNFFRDTHPRGTYSGVTQARGSSPGLFLHNLHSNIQNIFPAHAHGEKLAFCLVTFKVQWILP